MFAPPCGSTSAQTTKEKRNAGIHLPRLRGKTAYCDRIRTCGLRGVPKAIGYVVRNNEGKRKKDQFVNTVDDVERITGYDFFPALPDSIENEVEAHASLDEWE